MEADVGSPWQPMFVFLVVLVKAVGVRLREIAKMRVKVPRTGGSPVRYSCTRDSALSNGGEADALRSKMHELWLQEVQMMIF